MRIWQGDETWLKQDGGRTTAGFQIEITKACERRRINNMNFSLAIGTRHANPWIEGGDLICSN